MFPSYVTFPYLLLGKGSLDELYAIPVNHSLEEIQVCWIIFLQVEDSLSHVSEQHFKLNLQELSQKQVTSH